MWFYRLGPGLLGLGRGRGCIRICAVAPAKLFEVSDVADNAFGVPVLTEKPFRAKLFGLFFELEK